MTRSRRKTSVTKPALNAARTGQFAKKNLAPGDVAGAYVAAGDVAGGDVAPGDDRSCIPSVVWWVALVWYIWWEIFSHDKHQNARASVASVKK